MIPQSNFIHSNYPPGSQQAQQQQPQNPQAFINPNVRMIPQPAQQSYIPYTPYTTQQPHPEIQQFAMHPAAVQPQPPAVQRMSLSDRLNQFHITAGGPPQQMPPGGNYSPQMNGGPPPQQQYHHGGGGASARLNNIRNNVPGAAMHGGGYNNHHHSQHHHQNDNRRHHHNNSHHVQHQPPQQQQQQQQQQQNDYEEHQPSETEDIALSYLGEVIHKLEDNPGGFEIYQKKIKEMFYELSNNNFVMSNALELLFKQSIKSQNFRYIGARICNLLDDLEPSPNSLFRTLLKLKMDFEKQELQAFMQNEQNTVRGTTLFLAELYMQLRRPNESQRNVEIAEFIVYSIMLLLSKTGPENLKCVCQTLKLCGFELDVDCHSNMEQIINELEPHKSTVDTSTGRLIQSVIDLRSKRWGRNESFSMPTTAELTSTVYTDGPVFYGPDGQVLTEEENSFLSSNTPSYPGGINFDELVDSDDDDSGEELVDDEQIDLEIQLAFKEFVNSNKNAAANNKK